MNTAHISRYSMKAIVAMKNVKIEVFSGIYLVLDSLSLKKCLCISYNINKILNKYKLKNEL